MNTRNKSYYSNYHLPETISDSQISFEPFKKVEKKSAPSIGELLISKGDKKLEGEKALKDMFLGLKQKQDKEDALFSQFVTVGDKLANSQTPQSKIAGFLHKSQLQAPKETTQQGK